ncbi:MAG: UDP-3-O-acyl-N-acetylglucosamine deacetylase [Candidatus Bruticola sp.]
MCRAQRTLAKEVSFEGVGIHTGRASHLTIKPAPVDHGLVFLSSGEYIPATYEYVISTKRSTTIGKGQVAVNTIEHLMAAFGGLSVDNALIEIEGPEVPILDGSALPFCQAMEEAGIVNIKGSEVEDYYLSEPIFAAEGDSLVLAMPDSQYNLEGAVSYNSPQVGIQRYRYCGYDNFVTHIAPARTFGFWSEVKTLLENGLGQGGDLSNALIYDRPGFNAAENQRFVNEPVRHKILDLAGDICLLGRPLCAFVLAVRAGHKLHVEFVRKIAEEMKKNAEY